MKIEGRIKSKSLDEVASLGRSDKFMSFREERSREKRDIPIEEAAKKRGIENL